MIRCIMAAMESHFCQIIPHGETALSPIGAMRRGDAPVNLSSEISREVGKSITYKGKRNEKTQ